MRESRTYGSVGGRSGHRRSYPEADAQEIARGSCLACVLGVLSCSGVQVPCPGVRGAEGQAKRQGVTARWGLKAAGSEGAGRGPRTGYEVWCSRGELARDSKALHPPVDGP
jgi:hypothetical protein